MLKRRSAYLKRVVRMNALRKGLIGGQPLWRAVWVFQLVRKFWGRVSKKGEAPITFSESLGEGEAWAIVHVPEDSRRGRGEGRRYLIGPKRPEPRFSAIGPTALVAAGRRVFEAPDAARVNQILGVDVVEDEPLSRKQRKRAAKAERKQDAAERKQDRKDAAAQAKRDARQAKRQAKRDKADAKQAEKAARTEARDAERAADARAKAERAEAAAARKRERAAARAARRNNAQNSDGAGDVGSLQESDA